MQHPKRFGRYVVQLNPTEGDFVGIDVTGTAVSGDVLDSTVPGGGGGE